MCRGIDVAYRELSVVAIVEMLRLWQSGLGHRAVADRLGVDRKTVRRYVEAATAVGVPRSAEHALDDATIGLVVTAVRPGRPAEAGAMRAHCQTHRERLRDWHQQGCRGPKLVELLARHTGVVVPLRTLQRFVTDELEAAPTTVRVADPPPGQILEIDFAEVGRLAVDGKRGPKLFALLCTASRSRYSFAWPCLDQTLDTLIEGLEAAWAFFGGVFRVVVSDNPRPIVDGADPLAPRFNEAFIEYAQARGFLVDTARVRRPQDKPRVERNVRFVRDDCFRGEHFADLPSARARAVEWAQNRSGMRIHGTTKLRPREAFEEERPYLLPAPSEPYDKPSWHSVVVGRDGMVAVASALYSVPFQHREVSVRVRVDRRHVCIYRKGQLLKQHDRAARGGVIVDEADLPPGTAELATRNGDALATRAEAHGPVVADYARRLLDVPLPWTRMRHVHRLLGLCRSYGDSVVAAACQAALDLDVVDVTRVQRMIERARAPVPPPEPPRGQELSLRFARPVEDFRRTPGGSDAAS